MGVDTQDANGARSRQPEEHHGLISGLVAQAKLNELLDRLFGLEPATAQWDQKPGTRGEEPGF